MELEPEYIITTPACAAGQTSWFWDWCTDLQISNLVTLYSKLLRKPLCKRNTLTTPTSFNVRSLGASIILLTTNVKRNISVEGDIRTILGSNAESVWVKGRAMDKHSGNLEPWIAMHSNIDCEWILPALCNLITEMTLSAVFKTH